jgi:glyoxylase-like metal-dependent hydrolase (beta-lactamase superfamily II)
LRVHHLNCLLAHPPGGRAFVAHCVLVETDDGLVLADTGLGLGDVVDPGQRLSKAFVRLLKPDLRAEMTAVRQIERLGFRASDVRDIVLTHLDFDQAGGLDDFPRARVHLMTAERDHAFAQVTWLDRQRYRPQQWSTRNHWITYDMAGGSPWMGLEGVHALCGLPPELLFVPLPGHTPGHAGVAIQGESGWMLLAGDAFYDPREIEATPRCRTGLRLLERVLAVDPHARQRSLHTLRRLHAEHPDITIFCAHDAEAFERLSGHAATEPPEARRRPGDPYVEKIVRRPMDIPLGPHTAAPGLEVIDYDDDIAFDFDSVPPPPENTVARPGS